MEPNDAALVHRAKAGDEAAFGLLLRRYLKVAHAVARAVAGPLADAEDVVQEAILEAVTQLERCRDPARFGGWLLAIVRTRAHNRRRYERRREALPLEAAEGLEASDQPEEALRRSELRQQLARGLNRLPSTEREVILLCDLEGWSHTEAAQLLGISAASSRQRLHRARKRLRAMLASGQARGENR